MKYIKIFESPRMRPTCWDAIDAIECGKINKLKNILKERPELLNFIYPNQNNQTLLFFAVDAGSFNSIIELTNAGANWFIKNSKGKYFFDFLTNEDLNVLKHLFPDKFKTKEFIDWELEQDAKKYNL